MSIWAKCGDLTGPQPGHEYSGALRRQSCRNRSSKVVVVAVAVAVAVEVAEVVVVVVVVVVVAAVVAAVIPRLSLKVLHEQRYLISTHTFGIIAYWCVKKYKDMQGFYHEQ